MPICSGSGIRSRSPTTTVRRSGGSPRTHSVRCSSRRSSARWRAKSRPACGWRSMSENLFTALAAGFPVPQASFVRDADGRSLSYAQLRDSTAQCANALRALGVQPGDRVAAQVDKSIDAIVLYLATLRAGAAFLPLNPAYTAAEMEYFIGDAQPRLLVCAPEKQAMLASIAAASG